MGALLREACPGLVLFNIPQWQKMNFCDLKLSAWMGCKAEEGRYESLAAGGLDNFADNFSAGFPAWLITLQRAEN